MIDKQLNDEAIAAHNAYRSMHGCPNIQLDLDLANSAQKYAELLAATGTLVHSACEGYGENLATRMSSGVVQLSGKEATKMWYDEINLHDFGGDFSPNSGKFRV
ncbi:hypothetical protein AHF37_00324 [Paragonimus kellicotti]|nr:hypothetical protein AHF37_00324 [Paragonimus kellicotti]